MNCCQLRFYSVLFAEQRVDAGLLCSRARELAIELRIQSATSLALGFETLNQIVQALGLLQIAAVDLVKL